MNLDLVALVPVAVSVGIYASMHGAFWRVLRAGPAGPPTGSGRTPRVTVLKPIAGIDDALAANLESFARLDYPDWELLFGFARA